MSTLEDSAEQTRPAPATIDELERLLADQLYITDRGLAISIFLALRLGRPLFLEGESGVGKTEVAKVLAAGLGRDLIRLQCYEGLDVSQAVYEWNYARQLLEIRVLEAAGQVDRQSVSREIFSEDFLIKRPLLQAIEGGNAEPPVLLIDEIDRADEEFEGFLLELLSDFQITIPELGTFRERRRAHRGHHVEQDAGGARRAEAQVPLLLDRIPRLPEGEPDRLLQGPGGLPQARRRGHRVRPGAARRGAVQGPRGL